jgi:transcriptional regulator GlxA family with amidase domain
VPAERRYQTRDVRLLKVIRAMEESMEEPLASDDLAYLCGVSQRQMERLFLGEIGTSARSLYMHLRLERAERLLTYGDMSVRETAIACGFSSLSQFSRAFRRHYGKPPSSYRQG